MKSHANLITDTVGAIAIDCFGNIAAGSSSGGAALKQPGRIGPVALVGIGTAVIPINPKDPQKACSVTVASGTGDHMSTTMAANSCARRVHSMTDSTNVIIEFIEHIPASDIAPSEDLLVYWALRKRLMASGFIPHTIHRALRMRICLRVIKSQRRSCLAPQIEIIIVREAKQFGITQTNQRLTLMIQLGLLTRTKISTLLNGSSTTNNTLVNPSWLHVKI